MRDLTDEARRRAQDRPVWLDDRWERLAAGTSPPEERAELQALAESSEEARRLWELCQPLPSEVRRKIVRRIVDPTPDETRAAASDASGTGETARRSGLGLPGGVWWWAPTALAAASVVAVIVFWPGRAAAPLPEYSAELAGGVRTQRSPDLTSEVPIFEPGTRFELTLRPQTRVEGALEIRGFLAPADRPGLLVLEPWLARSVPPGKGAATLDAIVGEDLELRPGTWELWLVIARPGAMPGTDELEADLAKGTSRGQGWTVAAPARKLRMKEP